MAMLPCKIVQGPKRCLNKVFYTAAATNVDMEKKQESEWFEAQEIVISLDLLVAAKQLLKFLAQVDRNRSLYDGHVLHKAIYRYNACWLPLLAKHSESPVCDGPLVVPLDCEWVWHCHRLNPVQYKSDCEELYGRVLDNSGVASSVNRICSAQTEEIWNQMYPDEAYHFDLNESTVVPDEKFSAIKKCTKYDLVSAVKRQIPFFYQVDRAHISNDVFLQEAVARYKGFLHLIKRNMENSLKHFCVPTYDVDLIWHTHQLHPVSYYKDLEAAVGKVLEHDDTDSDRAKGKKLDTGFSGTTKQWEDTFGRRYWKAGAIYRGTTPTPLTSTPFSLNTMRTKTEPSDKFQNMIQLPELKIVEVFLEIVGVKNLPEGLKGNLFVRFSKKQADPFFSGKRKVSILSESGRKQVAAFQCEPKGDIFFELMLHSPSNRRPVTKGSKRMGTVTLSLSEFLNPLYKLSDEKWVELQSSSRNVNSKPVCIRIASSFTVPTRAPHVLHFVRSRPLAVISWFFSLLGKVHHHESWIRVIDGTNNRIISLQLRDLSAEENLKEKTIVKKQITGVMKSGEACIVAESIGNTWSLMDSQWSLQPKEKSTEGDHLFELMGSKMVRVYLGRKLDFQHNLCEGKRYEPEFMTAVEFSEQDPYGKAVALFDLKLGIVVVKEEWFVLPGILSAMLASDVLKTSYDVFNVNEKDLDVNSEASVNRDNVVKRGGCGGGVYGGGYGHVVYGGGCSAGCGHVVNCDDSGAEYGGDISDCGAGCSSSCGTGCGGGGGCGGGCGGGG